MCYKKALLTTAAHQYYRQLFGNFAGYSGGANERLKKAYGCGGRMVKRHKARTGLAERGSVTRSNFEFQMRRPFSGLV